jgi:hypothetical protein
MLDTDPDLGINESGSETLNVIANLGNFEKEIFYLKSVVNEIKYGTR